MAQAVSDHVLDSEGKPFVLTFTKGIPPSASEVFLFLLDDGSIHQGVIDYTSKTFPQGAVSTTNPIGGFHEKFEIPLRRVAGYAFSGPHYDTRERSIWLKADFIAKGCENIPSNGKNMNITPMDQAISALRVAPIETLGMSVCTVMALVLFGQDSHWWGTAFVIAMIFGALLYRVTPAISKAAKERTKARNSYPY